VTTTAHSRRCSPASSRATRRSTRAPATPTSRCSRPLAFVGDRLGYFENRSALEAFLPTAVLRASVIAHARLIGYELAGPTPAVATLALTLARACPDPVTFAAGTRVETEDGAVGYEFDADVTIPAGDLLAIVAATEGWTATQSATGIAPADAPGGQRVELTEPGFLRGTARVAIGTDLWSRVDDLLNSHATDRHYVVEVDAADRASLGRRHVLA
jgi:hypothetical protein